MLPDEASGQGTGTLAPPAGGSRCKEGMARVFAIRVQILLSITRVAPAPLMQSKSGGTSLIEAANLSPVTNLVEGTGPA